MNSSMHFAAIVSAHRRTVLKQWKAVRDLYPIIKIINHLFKFKSSCGFCSNIFNICCQLMSKSWVNSKIQIGFPVQSLPCPPQPSQVRVDCFAPKFWLPALHSSTFHFVPAHFAHFILVFSNLWAISSIIYLYFHVILI